MLKQLSCLYMAVVAFVVTSLVFVRKFGDFSDLSFVEFDKNT